jgi:hypothetical protein
MSDATIMRAKDTLQGSSAECYATVNGKRYNFMQMINLEAKATKTKTQVPILGKTGKGNKATGWAGTFTGRAHYNTSIFRKMMKEFKDSGDDVYFDMEVTNKDKSSAAGNQSITLLDCNLDESIIAKFDADGEYLDEDVNGTFEDFLMPEEFDELPGFAE